MDENNEQFVAYFLPTPDTLRTRHSEESEALEGDPEQESVSLRTREELRRDVYCGIGMSIR